MESKLKEFWEEVKQCNDKIIAIQDVQPFCFTMDKEGKIQVIAITNLKDKEMSRQVLKKLLVMKELEGYMLIFDSYLTEIDRKTGESKTNDVIVRTLYTPQEKIMELVYYDKATKKILKKDVIEGRAVIDEWDLWGEGFSERHQKIVDEYNKLKEEEPERFK